MTTPNPWHQFVRSSHWGHPLIAQWCQQTAALTGTKLEQQTANNATTASNSLAKMRLIASLKHGEMEWFDRTLLYFTKLWFQHSWTEQSIQETPNQHCCSNPLGFVFFWPLRIYRNHAHRLQSCIPLLWQALLCGPHQRSTQRPGTSHLEVPPSKRPAVPRRLHPKFAKEGWSNYTTNKWEDVPNMSHTSNSVILYKFKSMLPLVLPAWRVSESWFPVRLALLSRRVQLLQHEVWSLEMLQDRNNNSLVSTWQHFQLDILWHTTQPTQLALEELAPTPNLARLMQPRRAIASACGNEAAG